MGSKQRLKYGTYAVVTTIVVIAIFIMINLIASTQNWKIDMTQNKIYSLSEQTKQVLSKLDQDIKVYVFYKKGEEDTRINQLLDNYKKLTPRIKVDYLDADRNPDKVMSYGVETYNGVVFESDKRKKIVNTYELYSYGEQGQGEFLGEQKFTNSIRYVTSEKIPTIYFIEGHKELSVNQLYYLSKALEIENYIVKPLNLITQKTVPEDADMLISVLPRVNYLPQEIQELEKYFSNGGRGIFLFASTLVGKQDISEIKGMMAKWGIGIDDDLAVEENPDSIYYGNPARVIANMQGHEITNMLKENNLLAVLGVSRSLKLPVQTEGQGQNGYNIESLLKSSDKSWGKVKFDTEQRTPEDLNGPLDLAAAISKKVGDAGNKEMRVVVFGSSNFIQDADEFDQNLKPILIPGNLDLFLNTVSWLKGIPEEITIRPKQTLESPLKMSKNQQITSLIIVLLLIPGAVFVPGMIVWARRRHL